jgi:hypothetical protein
MAPSEILCSYGFGRRIEGSLTEAIEKVTGALKNEGFGVLTEINVKDTLKKQLDVEFRGYVILGACNPPLAHQALTAEPGTLRSPSIHARFGVFKQGAAGSTEPFRGCAAAITCHTAPQRILERPVARSA